MAQYREISRDIETLIIFAGLDWESAAIHNAIARYIIEKSYGYKTDAIPGSTFLMLQGSFRNGVAKAHPDTVLEELLPLAAQSRLPIAVLDEQGALVRVIPRAAVLSALAGTVHPDGVEIPAAVPG